MPSASGAEDIDAARESLAYNVSIYSLIGIPFLSLGGVGFWVYRALQRHAAAQALSEPGGHPWTVLSPGEGSLPPPAPAP